MKRFFYISTLLFALSGFAQENKITFDNLYQYSIKKGTENDSENPDLNIKYYFSSTKKINFFDLNVSGINSEYSLVKDGKYLKINSIGLDNEILISNTDFYSFPSMLETAKLFNYKIKLEPLNKKGSFSGISCDYYLIKIDEINELGSIEDDKLCFCIDTKSKVKNFKALFPNANIDGLLLSYGHLDYPDNEISLDRTKKVDIKIDFDFDAEYKKIEELYAAYQIENDANEETIEVTDYTTVSEDSDYYSNYYNDPLCNYYQYFDDLEAKVRDFAFNFSSTGCTLKNADSDYDGQPDLTREQAILIFKKQVEASIKQARKSKILSKNESKQLTKSFEKLFKDAEAFVLKEQQDSVEYATGDVVDWDLVEPASEYDSYSDFRKYKSDYRNIDVQTISLAAESQFDENVKNYMPDYCANLKQNIPAFKNQDLKKHVYNLVGQMCDLYLYQNGGYVDYFGTIDSMRKSMLEIENLRAELSKSDVKMLNEYLNSLD